MISIIIPVYNTKSELLQRCLKSITEQTYQNYEIIIVDDGSTSISHDDFSAIESLDHRIRIIHQSNQGVSEARNKGIENANGEYIAFVDGDDEITPAFLKDASEMIEQQNADAVIGTIQYIYEDHKEEIEEDEKVFVFDENTMNTLRRSLLKLRHPDFPYRVLGSPCGRIIRKDVLKEIRFNSKIKVFEDQLFNRSLVAAAKKIVYTHRIWYLYYQYNDSSIHSTWAEHDRRYTFLNLDYIQEWNRMNLSEPDESIRKELCIKSLHTFSAAVKYWVTSRNSYFASKKEIRNLYDRVHIKEVTDQLSLSDVKSAKDKSLYLMAKFRLFNMLTLLSMANPLRD